MLKRLPDAMQMTIVVDAVAPLRTDAGMQTASGYNGQRLATDAAAGQLGRVWFADGHSLARMPRTGPLWPGSPGA
jgi:hypothetical protein